ncbi:Glycosyltransferase like family 2 [Azospirillum oryzae]|uniref:Glycosyltransferase like family 2 n=1 Tax=Azospirillum oryzae TaxID=286727 RepID=A0A1X7F1N2_9PROT|nr:glycosyltransferase [Azospirillum oryzae]SMF43974.1 Glycosyltransferase like family 2 [Azospirillum oryzae]
MVKTPDIAVIMAAYNADGTLPDAVASVLASTVPVHLFVVDDASGTPAEMVLRNAFGCVPDWVEVIRNHCNLGVSATRNRALRHILAEGYRYAAVLDADDIAHPERFEKQAAYLNTHSCVAAVGSWANAVDEHTLAVVRRVLYPSSDPETVRRDLCFDSPIVNSSVMFRVDALREVGLWDERLRTAEDYDLFCRLAARFDLANLPEILVDFRLCRTGLSRAGINAQRRARLRVQLRYFPERAWRWQAWAGIVRSTVRLLVPTSLVEGMKSRRIAVERT